MKVHFIAIGGAAMHNLAIALHLKGFQVSGSDDEIVEPSASRLKKYHLFPQQPGWFPEKIDSSVDAVILGMHARLDNPEILKAQETGVKIFSYPEYIYEQSKNKKRVVIGGSHGKTTITAMIMHVLHYLKKDFDYMVGSQLEGFETMVKLTSDAPCIILEGDEYLASPLDRRPKFHLYHPQIALLSGIAWDHINVFPTFDIYLEQFRAFIDLIEKGGTLVWCGMDEELKKMVAASRKDIQRIEYRIPAHKIENGITYLMPLQNNSSKFTELKIFGDHNLMNSEGARVICNQLGISDDAYFEAISSFKGAARRLELIAKNEQTAFYKDFAHSPSKLKATTEAVKKQYPERKLIACMELHTFSSLSEKFLSEYKDSMSIADEAFVYYNPHTIAHKKLKPITDDQVRVAFGGNNLEVITDSKILRDKLQNKNWMNRNLLMMSSGTFDGLDYYELADSIIK